MKQQWFIYVEILDFNNMPTIHLNMRSRGNHIYTHKTRHITEIHVEPQQKQQHFRLTVSQTVNLTSYCPLIQINSLWEEISKSLHAEMQNKNIWISAPVIIDLPASLFARFYRKFFAAYASCYQNEILLFS